MHHQLKHLRSPRPSSGLPFVSLPWPLREPALVANMRNTCHMALSVEAVLLCICSHAPACSSRNAITCHEQSNTGGCSWSDL